MGLIRFFHNYHTTLRYNHLDKSRILEIQKQRLRRVLHYAVTNSEFYKELYRGIDIDNCQLSDLPVVSKSAMIENWDRFITDKRLKHREIQKWRCDEKNDAKSYLGDFIPIYTSGSSGEQALIIYHRKALEMVQASLFTRIQLNTMGSAYNYTKMLALQLLGKKVRMAAITIPRGNMQALLDYAPPLHNFFVQLKILSTLDPIHQIVEQLNEFQPDSLISFPFLIASLAQEQLAGRLNIKLDHPRSFIAGAGEPLTEHTQKLAEMAWNKKIQNIYGALECYVMATSCQNFNRLHVMSDLCILEIVDHDNNLVPKGQHGEKLLLTNLFNFIQPIIRYEIEDVTGYANQNCECGLPSPTLLPVQGRTMDFIYVKKDQGGYMKFHPYNLLVPLRYINDLRQYQIVQTARNELTFYYVSPNNAVEIELQLIKTLKKVLAQAGIERQVQFKFKQVQSISRDMRSGKYKVIKSMGTPARLDGAP